MATLGAAICAATCAAMRFSMRVAEGAIAALLRRPLQPLKLQESEHPLSTMNAWLPPENVVEVVNLSAFVAVLLRVVPVMVKLCSVAAAGKVTYSPTTFATSTSRY